METPDLMLHRETGTLKEAYLSHRKIFSLCLLFKEIFFSMEEFASWAQRNDGQISNSGFELRLIHEIRLLLMPAPQLNLFLWLIYIMSIYINTLKTWSGIITCTSFKNYNTIF